MLQLLIKKRTVFPPIGCNFSALVTIRLLCFTLCSCDKTYKMHESKESIQAEKINNYPLHCIAITEKGETSKVCL